MDTKLISSNQAIAASSLSNMEIQQKYQDKHKSETSRIRKSKSVLKNRQKEKLRRKKNKTTSR